MKREKGNEMKFTFDYEETLCRRVTIDCDSMEEAIAEIKRRINDEEIVLDSEDFCGGEISMPLEENFFPRLRELGQTVKNKSNLDIVVDCW